MILAPTLPWPLHGGRQINAHHLMHELVQQGHQVLLVLRDAPGSSELAAWPLAGHVPVVVMRPPAGHRPLATAPLATCAKASRWHRFFGDPPAYAQEAARIAREYQPQYVEGCGLETPLWMTRLPATIPRVWLAADEKFLFHTSMLTDAGSLRKISSTLREAIQLALYERWCARTIDTAVLVARDDAAMFRRITGIKHVLVAPNGVDHAFFHPGRVAPRPQTAVFWGRLDFEPNQEAVRWFARKVWPLVLGEHPQAQWRVVGRSPTPPIAALLARTRGTQLVADPPDIRPWVQDSALAVLPVRGGSGIKNKLLEAAAMGKAIVASPNTVRGCQAEDPQPWQVATSARQWAQSIAGLWADPRRTADLGQRARQWILARDGWRQGLEIRLRWLAQTGRLPGASAAASPKAEKGLAA